MDYLIKKASINDKISQTIGNNIGYGIIGGCAGLEVMFGLLPIVSGMITVIYGFSKYSQNKSFNDLTKPGCMFVESGLIHIFSRAENHEYIKNVANTIMDKF